MSFFVVQCTSLSVCLNVDKKHYSLETSVISKLTNNWNKEQVDTSVRRCFTAVQPVQPSRAPTNLGAPLSEMYFFRIWTFFLHDYPSLYNATMQSNATKTETSVLGFTFVNPALVGQYKRLYSSTSIVKAKPRFLFKRNRLRCVRWVNENRKKRKRLRWQAANHGCHCFDRAFLLAEACVCCVKISRNKRNGMETGLKPAISMDNGVYHGLYGTTSCYISHWP